MDFNLSLLKKHRQHLVEEYRKVKAGIHDTGKKVSELARINGVRRKHLWELAKRFEKNQVLLPEKRGPKQAARKTAREIEQAVCQSYETETSSSERLKANHPEFPSARTIRRIIQRQGLKPKKLKPAIIRYEHSNPGSLGHIDLKKLPNVAGEDPKEKQYLAGLEDDHTRIVYQERLPNKEAKTVSCFFERAADWFEQEHSIRFIRLLSDNGTEFTTHHVASRPKHVFEQTLARCEVRHKYTKPYRPQTNGKIERYWQIFEQECWKTQRFESWQAVDQALKLQQEQYNHWRKHGGIGYQTPIQRLQQWQEKYLIFFLALLLSQSQPARGKGCPEPSGGPKDRLLTSFVSSGQSILSKRTQSA